MDRDHGAKREYWQEHFERQKASGLGQRANCRNEDLSLSQFR